MLHVVDAGTLTRNSQIWDFYLLIEPQLRYPGDLTNPAE
jgi:hypothetical protein